jgi:hypothetical protein
MARENQKIEKSFQSYAHCDIITSGESRKLQQQLLSSRQFCLRTQIDAERAGRRRSRTPFFI